MSEYTGGHDKTRIQNLGASCYINAVSQLLVMIPNLPKNIKIKNKEYGEFLETLKNTPKDNISEIDFISKCIKNIGYMNAQDDAANILYSLDLAMINSKYYYKFNFDTDTKNMEEPFINLSLDKNSSSVVKLWYEFVGKQEIESANDRKGLAVKNPTREIIFTKLSDNLIVKLGVFSFDKNSGTSQKIELSPNDFNVDDAIHPEENNGNNKNYKNYDLSGVVLHSGTLNSGHYIIIKKVDNKWVCINDDTVLESSRITFNDVWNTVNYHYNSKFTPYILLYQTKINKPTFEKPKTLEPKQEPKQEPKKRKITKDIIDKLLYSGAFHVYKSSMDAIIQEYIDEVSNDKEIDNICEISKYIIESIKYELYSSADIDKKIKQLSLNPEIDANETQVRNSILQFCENKNKIYKNNYNINKNVIEKMIVSGVFHVYKSSIGAIMQEYIDKISNDKEIDNICEISKYIIESIKYSLYSNTSIDPIVKKLALSPEIDKNVSDIKNQITDHINNYIHLIYIKYGIKDVLMNYKNHMKPLIAPQNSIIETVSNFFSPSQPVQPKSVPQSKPTTQSKDNYELKNYISTNVQYNVPIGFGNGFNKISGGHITVITMFFNTDEESKLNRIINENYFSTYNQNKKFNKFASVGEKKVVALLNPFYGLEFDNWLFDILYRYTKEITLTTPKYEKLGEKFAITYSDGKQNMGVLHKLIYDKITEILQPGVSQQTITISGKQYYAIINNNTGNWIFATPKYADNIWHITVQSGVETDRDLIMRLPDLKNIKMNEKMMISYLSFLKGDKLTVTGGSDSQNFDLYVDESGRIFYNNVETPFSSLPQNIQNKLK